MAVLAVSGCSSFDTVAIPAHRVPTDVLGRPREEMRQISLSRLGLTRPEVEQLGPGDILGIHIEFVLGKEGEAPHVFFPEQGDQPPALGIPVPVREDGTLALPLIPPVLVDGMTLTQATEAVRRTYIENEILQPGQDKIIVTLIRRRQHRVTVIREEAGGQQGVLKRGTGTTLDLPAYQNDVLHALNETGGLPGLDAKNEIYIIRAGFTQGAEWDALVAQLSSCKEPCSCPPIVPDAPNITRIPLRYYPENVPMFTEEDIILNTGDIVYIPSRDQEKFYTGGALPGGEHPIPRDYDLTVLGAVALAGGSIGSGGTGIAQVGGAGGGGGVGRTTGCTPSKLIVIRKLECGGQLPIEIDLNRAIMDEQHQILVQPEDTLILKYRFHEELYNAALNMISFNFLTGIRGF